MNDLRPSVRAFCARIGADPLIVQGAGGNVSWKDGDTLWIKGSGEWLAEAAARDLFVPVDLAHLRTALAAGAFDTAPRTIVPSRMRPSIETSLHALMPHAVVAHLHLVAALAVLVQDDCEARLRAAIDPSIGWRLVDYERPGAALARTVAYAAATAPIDVVFLRNHGVVIGGATVGAVDACIGSLGRSLDFAIANDAPNPDVLTTGLPAGYEPIADLRLHRLAREPALLAHVDAHWALFPDHVVFLGAHPVIVSDVDAWARCAQLRNAPALVFVRGIGVYVRHPFSAAKLAQLRGYLDVVERIAPGSRVRVLPNAEVAALLDWDAERYRMSLAR